MSFVYCRKADFTGADLRDARMYFATLIGVTMSEAKTNGLYLGDATVSKTHVPEPMPEVEHSFGR